MEETFHRFSLWEYVLQFASFQIENIGDMMEPIAAGLAAWLIELAVAEQCSTDLVGKKRKSLQVHKS